MIVLRMTGKEPGSRGHGIAGAAAVIAPPVTTHRAHIICESDEITALILAAQPHVGRNNVTRSSHCGNKILSMVADEIQLLKRKYWKRKKRAFLTTICCLTDECNAPRDGDEESKVVLYSIGANVRTETMFRDLFYAEKKGFEGDFKQWRFYSLENDRMGGCKAVLEVRLKSCKWV